MGERLFKKVDRLDQLKQLLLDRRLTKAEIARKLGVHRSTAAEYIADLDAQNIPVREEDGYFFIDRDLYKFKVEFTQHEGLALHLAARLLTTNTDKQNPHAASALRKLGEATQGFAPLFSEHLQRSADVLEPDASRRRDPVFIQVLEMLTCGLVGSWGDGGSMTHQMEDGGVFEYDFAPYFIEPYAVGRTLHTIGLREPPWARCGRSKVEADPHGEPAGGRRMRFPGDFDPRETLKDAVGHLVHEGPPGRVVLRFSRQVAARVPWDRDGITPRRCRRGEGRLAALASPDRRVGGDVPLDSRLGGRSARRWSRRCCGWLSHARRRSWRGCIR